MLRYYSVHSFRNQQGQTAIDLAMKSNNNKLISLLQTVQRRNSSNNELPTGPPARRRGRTASSSHVVFLTGFDKARKESLMKSVQTIFGRKTVSTLRIVENNGQ